MKSCYLLARIKENGRKKCKRTVNFSKWKMSISHICTFIIFIILFQLPVKKKSEEYRIMISVSSSVIVVNISINYVHVISSCQTHTPLTFSDYFELRDADLQANRITIRNTLEVYVDNKIENISSMIALWNVYYWNKRGKKALQITSDILGIWFQYIILFIRFLRFSTYISLFSSIFFCFFIHTYPQSEWYVIVVRVIVEVDNKWLFYMYTMYIVHFQCLFLVGCCQQAYVHVGVSS